MSLLTLQITYRSGEPCAAYIDLPRPPGTKVARTEQVHAELVVDYAADGAPLGIEIVSPGAVSIAESMLYLMSSAFTGRTRRSWRRSRQPERASDAPLQGHQRGSRQITCLDRVGAALRRLAGGNEDCA